MFVRLARLANKPMTHEDSKRPSRPIGARVSQAVLLLFAVPVVGVLFGGIYSIPADYLTHGRDPWFTMLLCMGLATSVLVLGFCDGLGWTPMLLATSVVWIVLLARRAFGKLNMEGFAQVHILAILAVAFFR